MSKNAPCSCQTKNETELEERHEAIAEAPVAAESSKPKYKFGKELSDCLPWFQIEKNANFEQCMAEARKLGQIDNAKKLLPLVQPYLEKQDQECFVAVSLDTQLYVRGITLVAKGERDRVSAPIPDILRVVIERGAMGFVVLHNHPSGKSRPSKADRDLTKAIAKAASCVDILLVDHIVIGTNEYYSFKDHGQL